jgi:hypothetical protein
VLILIPENKRYNNCNNHDNLNNSQFFNQSPVNLGILLHQIFRIKGSFKLGVTDGVKKLALTDGFLKMKL